MGGGEAFIPPPSQRAKTPPRGRRQEDGRNAPEGSKAGWVSRLLVKRTSGRSNEGLQLLRMVNGDDGIFNADPALFAELSERPGDGFAGGAGHGSHFFMGKKEGEA